VHIPRTGIQWWPGNMSKWKYGNYEYS
jgi:hypothetical protein